MTQEPSDLHRTNINLYAADVQWLRTCYGWGWSEYVREIVHEVIVGQRQRLEQRRNEMHNEQFEPAGPQTDPNIQARIFQHNIGVSRRYKPIRGDLEP